MDKRKRIQELLDEESKIKGELEKLAEDVYFEENGKKPQDGHRKALRELGFIA